MNAQQHEGRATGSAGPPLPTDREAGEGVAPQTTAPPLTRPAAVAGIAGAAGMVALGCALLAALTAPPVALLIVLWAVAGLVVLIGTVVVVRGVHGGVLRYDWLGGVVATEAVVVGLVVLFVRAPDLYPLPPPVPEAPLQAARESARSAGITGLRTAVLAGLAGLAAIGGLVVNAANSRLAQRTAQQTAKDTQLSLELTRSGQLTDRYAKGIELLGNDNLTIRQGGVYALQQVATDATRDSDQAVVVEVLSAFVRRHLHAPPEDQTPPPGDRSPAAGRPVAGRRGVAGTGLRAPAAPKRSGPVGDLRADVLAAISVLAQLPVREGVMRADFTGLDFTGLRLAPARLHHGNLTRTNLSGLILGADLVGADLTAADLTAADLTAANLSGANLSDAVLRHTFLDRANLSQAWLMDAILRGTFLRGAILRGANLSGANLSGAFLDRAILSGADLTDAQLTNAALDGADVRAVDLSVVADLSGVDLSVAIGDESTVLPHGVERPAHWTTTP